MSRAWSVDALSLTVVLTAWVVADDKPVGKKAEAGKVIRPFNGRNLDGWTPRKTEGRMSRWVVGHATLDREPERLKVTPLGKGEKTAKPELIQPGGGTDLYTDQKFGDCTIEVEFMLPKGSNSGVYVMGEYEVQILDSFGKEKVGPGDLGAIYRIAAPKENAAKKHGEWQKFVIDFRAPRFDEAGKKTANAKFVKVTLNGTLIHENVEAMGPTGGALTAKEAPTGPLMFQGDHGPVAFRNIKVTTRGEK
jgi:hypothetical protein